MEAWPIEEAYVVRPLGSVALAVGLPFLVEAALSRLAGDPETLARARTPVRATLLSLAFVLGGTALGPSLSEASGGVASHAMAFLCAALLVLADARAVAAPDARAAGVGFVAAALACGASLALGFEHSIAVGAAVMAITGAVAYRPPAPTSDATHAFGWFLGGAAALMLVAAFAAPIPLTEILPEDVPYHGDATWRLRVDPWDPVAMLATGWAAREREELTRATACARESVRMGGARGPALELEAEVLAARGECEAARSMFDRALRARARESFEDDSILTPLVLGGYQLPPTLITACGGLEELPSVGDLRPP
ncbi:MAG: hypothetical protein H6719_00695 [Sandaracinaceae bacterium]|nr:hypothetical protein [Sandaracinaceae bacterium]